MDGTRFVVVGTTTTVVALVVTCCWWWWWWWSLRRSTPTKWRKVGEISEIFFFPVKSLGPIRVTDIECTILGCKSGWLRDRTLMIIDSSTGRFVTARKIPKMVQVSPSSSGSVLTLRAPGMMKIDVDLAHIGRATDDDDDDDGGKIIMSSVWDQPVPARDCGEQVARWLSRFLLQEDTGLRLVYYPLDKPYRDIRPCNRGFPRMKSTDTGAYSDTTAYTLLNESSIADLNSRLECPVTPLHFRMNFIVRGAKIFVEDSWDWIKIGSVIFRNVKPCTRCIFTTIDPDAGVKNEKTEPLKTLMRNCFRQIEIPDEIRRLVGDSPVMGIHLGLRGPSAGGIVTLGDGVFVGE